VVSTGSGRSYALDTKAARTSLKDDTSRFSTDLMYKDVEHPTTLGRQLACR